MSSGDVWQLVLTSKDRRTRGHTIEVTSLQVARDIGWPEVPPGEMDAEARRQRQNQHATRRRHTSAEVVLKWLRRCTSAVRVVGCLEPHTVRIQPMRTGSSAWASLFVRRWSETAYPIFPVSGAFPLDPALSAPTDTSEPRIFGHNESVGFPAEHVHARAVSGGPRLTEAANMRSKGEGG